MFEDIEKMKANRQERERISEFLEDMMIEAGPINMKKAFMLGKEIRLFCADLKRLMHYIDRPEEEAAQIYTDALEYVRLAHEGLRSFMKAHVEKYGEGVIDEPV